VDKRFPLPMNDAEFAILGMKLCGVPLKVKTLRSGSYEIQQSHDELAKALGFHSNSCDGYAVVRDIWKQIFGELYCGGISRSSYGQFRPRGHRSQKRIANWVQQRSGRGFSGLRPAFARLAAQSRERREQPDSR
jgi:hypothetical protein